MNEYEVMSTKLEDTQLFSKRLASFLQPGDVITLEGDLRGREDGFYKRIGAWG